MFRGNSRSTTLRIRESYGVYIDNPASSGIPNLQNLEPLVSIALSCQSPFLRSLYTRPGNSRSRGSPFQRTFVFFFITINICAKKSRREPKRRFNYEIDFPPGSDPLSPRFPQRNKAFTVLINTQRAAAAAAAAAESGSSHLFTQIFDEESTRQRKLSLSLAGSSNNFPRAHKKENELAPAA